MPENNTTTENSTTEKEVKVLPPLIEEPLKVTRNNTTVSLVDRTKEKGKAHGEHYISIDPATQFQHLVHFLGNDLPDIVWGYVHRTFQGITAVSLKDDGTLDIPAFLKYAAEFEAKEESLRELQKQAMALAAEFISLDLSVDTNIPKLKELQGQLQSIQASIALKKKAKAVAAAAAADEDAPEK